MPTAPFYTHNRKKNIMTEKVTPGQLLKEAEEGNFCFFDVFKEATELQLVRGWVSASSGWPPEDLPEGLETAYQCVQAGVGEVTTLSVRAELDVLRRLHRLVDLHSKQVRAENGGELTGASLNNVRFLKLLDELIDNLEDLEMHLKPKTPRSVLPERSLAVKWLLAIMLTVEGTILLLVVTNVIPGPHSVFLVALGFALIFDACAAITKTYTIPERRLRAAFSAATADYSGAVHPLQVELALKDAEIALLPSREARAEASCLVLAELIDKLDESTAVKNTLLENQ